MHKGLEIMADLQGHTSGLCVPHYAVDLPGGGGKVPLLPRYVLGVDGDDLMIRNYKGETHRYPLYGSERGWLEIPEKGAEDGQSQVFGGRGNRNRVQLPH